MKYEPHRKKRGIISCAGLSKEGAASVDAALHALEYWESQVRACQDAADFACTLTFVSSQTTLHGIQAWMRIGSSTTGICQVSTHLNAKCA